MTTLTTDEQLAIISKSWKQPISTGFNQLFGNDYACKFIFIELLMRAKNRDEEVIMSGARQDLVFLKRGQCVCGKAEVGSWFERSRDWVTKRFDLLRKHYNLIDTLPTPEGTIVTIKNYDKLVEMGSLKNSLNTTKTQLKNTNKSDKSDKSDKNDKNDIYHQIQIKPLTIQEKMNADTLRRLGIEGGSHE